MPPCAVSILDKWIAMAYTLLSGVEGQPPGNRDPEMQRSLHRMIRSDEIEIAVYCDQLSAVGRAYDTPLIAEGRAAVNGTWDDLQRVRLQLGQRVQLLRDQGRI